MKQVDRKRYQWSYQGNSASSQEGSCQSLLLGWFSEKEDLKQILEISQWHYFLCFQRSLYPRRVVVIHYQIPNSIPDSWCEFVVRNGKKN